MNEYREFKSLTTHCIKCEFYFRNWCLGFNLDFVEIKTNKLFKLFEKSKRNFKHRYYLKQMRHLPISDDFKKEMINYI